jgi:hypothetical protein
MNTQIDSYALHATYAPSAAHRWAMEDGCTASAEAIAHLGEQEEGEEAAKGTAAHDELERCLGSLNGEFVDPATMPILPVDPDHASVVGITRAINFIRKLSPGRMWVEKRVRLTDHIWGKPDVQHWCAKTAILTTVDLKDGFVGVSPDTEQLRIYAAAGITTYGLPAKWLRNVICQENDFQPVPRIKQWYESAESLFAFAQRVAAIPHLLPWEPGEGQNAGGVLPSKYKRFVAGSQCTYCPLFGRCPASRDLLRDVSALVAGLMTADQVSPAQRALFLACAKPIKDAFDGAQKVWAKQALAGTAQPGLKVVTALKHKAWSNLPAARMLVLDQLGPDGLDLPTPAQAIERGIDEATVNAMAPRPEGSPVLAFANDKRPDWVPKTVSSMFGAAVKAANGL